MSGVKGRSGRRTTSVEEKCLALRDKAREITLSALNDSSITLIERAKIANPISVKEMAQRIEGISTPISHIIITHDKPIVNNRINELEDSKKVL